MKYLLPFVLLTSLLCPVVRGQGPAVSGNETKVRAVLSNLNQIYPHDWRFVILEEKAWNSVHNKSTEIAFTVRALRTTYIRESFLTTSTIPELRHVMLHEAGHIACACENEHTAELFAQLRQ
jgi:hypothetical protein